VHRAATLHRRELRMFVERPDARLYWEAAGNGTPDIFL
jgi:hypothetical protein